MGNREKCFFFRTKFGTCSTVQLLQIMGLSVATIITSRVSGRGNRIGPVCLSVCVCVRVCLATLGRGNFTTQVVGGASMLRHFHVQVE